MANKPGGSNPPPPPGPRPLDLTPHTEREYFVLLVGINDYQAPVSPLGGCIKDINNLEKYAKKNFSSEKSEDAKIESTETYKVAQPTTQAPDMEIKVHKYGPLHIMKLADADATYDNINFGFRSFLARARKTDKFTDIAWYHFSGHGSEQLTAQEFIDEGLVTNGKDQTAVCYTEIPDGDLSKAKGLHLADKDTAVLLDYVATKYPLVGKEIKEKDGIPHIFVSLDCCHSGGGTRDISEKKDANGKAIRSRKFNAIHAMKRAAGENQKLARRSLDSYVNGYYKAQRDKNTAMQVPMARYANISACKSIQFANDMYEGGAFTTSMLNALNASDGNINYPDLHIRTRAMLRKEFGPDQTPQLDVFDGFNSFTKILDGGPMGSPTSYPVVVEEGNWVVKCGAVHGVPSLKSGDTPTQIEIFEEKSGKLSAIARGEITDVGAQKSSFNILPAKGTNKVPELTNSENIHYKAELSFIPEPPLQVHIHGDATGVAALKKAWGDKVAFVKPVETEDLAELEVEISKAGNATTFTIRDLRINKEIKTWSQKTPEDSAIATLGSLEQIVKFERMADLHNPSSEIGDWVEFDIDIFSRVEGKMKVVKSIKDSDETIEMDPEVYMKAPGGIGASFEPRWTIKNDSQDLYGYIFYMGRLYDHKENMEFDYRIQLMDEPFAFLADEGNESLERRISKRFGWGLSNSDINEGKEATIVFKLLVTTEKLDHHQLEQTGIPLRKDRSFTFDEDELLEEASKVKNDWFTYTYRVTLAPHKKVPA